MVRRFGARTRKTRDEDGPFLRSRDGFGASGARGSRARRRGRADGVARSLDFLQVLLPGSGRRPGRRRGAPAPCTRGGAPHFPCSARVLPTTFFFHTRAGPEGKEATPPFWFLRRARGPERAPGRFPRHGRSVSRERKRERTRGARTFLAVGKDAARSFSLLRALLTHVLPKPILQNTTALTSSPVCDIGRSRTRSGGRGDRPGPDPSARVPLARRGGSKTGPSKVTRSVDSAFCYCLPSDPIPG